MPKPKSEPAEREVDRDERFRLRAVSVVVAAAVFGPYLAAGIRLEQVVVYAAATLAVLRTGKGRFQPTALGLAGIWLLILLVSIASAIDPPPAAEPGFWLTGVDALLLPGATLVLISALTGSATFEERRRLLERVQLSTVLMLSVNTLLSLAMNAADITGPVSGIFWSSSTSPGARATGEFAFETGRIGGVFNSPLAAGIAYGIGLLSLAHLTFTKKLSGPPLLAMFGAILVGGIMCQSKVFLFVALPAGVVLLLVATARDRAKRIIQVGAASVLVLVWMRTTDWWTTSGALLVERFFSANGSDLVGYYTAGRYGGAPVVGGLTERVEQTAPFGGYGVTNTLGPLDTGYLELLARAGLIGVALGTVFALTIAHGTLRRRAVMPRPSWWTLVLMLVIAAASVAGGPSVTQNRAGTLLVMGVVTFLVTWDPPSQRVVHTATPATSRHTVTQEQMSFAERGIETAVPTPINGRLTSARSSKLR